MKTRAVRNITLNPTRVFVHLTMIYVTGGTGFLGAHLLVELVSSDRKIIATKRVTSSLDYVKKVFTLAGVQSSFDKIEWINVDFFDNYQVEDSLEGIEEIYHCASEVSFDPNQHRRMLYNNTTITANLVNAAIVTGVKKFMHVSSIAALGRSAQEEKIDESRIWKTDPVNSKYGLSKYKSEMEAWRGYEEGLPVIVVNPAVILGYCKWNEGTGKMFTRANSGMKYFTNGYTGWVDVKDVAKCMVQLMQKEKFGERYILSAETRGFRTVLDLMAEALDKPLAKKEANLKLARWVILAEKWRSKITGNPPLITKETLRNATLQCNYINEKVKKEIGIEFTSVEKTIREVALIFRSENQEPTS